MSMESRISEIYPDYCKFFKHCSQDYQECQHYEDCPIYHLRQKQQQREMRENERQYGGKKHESMEQVA